jgi:hypothetical protein
MCCCSSSSYRLDDVCNSFSICMSCEHFFSSYFSFLLDKKRNNNTNKEDRITFSIEKRKEDATYIMSMIFKRILNISLYKNNLFFSFLLSINKKEDFIFINKYYSLGKEFLWFYINL